MESGDIDEILVTVCFGNCHYDSYEAASDENFVNMKIFLFQWYF